MKTTNRRLLATLTALGGVNLAAAVVLVETQPSRAGDLMTVYGWCAEWLRHGVDLYSQPQSTTDYPPQAIVMLSPLALIPERWIAPIWTIASIALAPLAALAVDRSSGNRSRDRTLLTIAAFLCWASARTLLQFSVLSMTLAFAAVVLADRRPLSSGIVLGLALAKPHIAGPVALWAVFSGRWKTTAAALVTVTAGLLIYCARAHVAPPRAAAGLWHVLAETYGGPHGLSGVTSIRGWTTSDATWIAVSAVLLVVPIAMAIRSRRAQGLERLAALACGCLWALLAFYHNGNNLILMLPAFVLLVAESGPWAVVVQAALMVDLPFRVAPLLPPVAVLRAFAFNAHRVLVLVVFALVTALWWRGFQSADRMSVSSEGPPARTSA